MSVTWQGIELLSGVGKKSPSPFTGREEHRAAIVGKRSAYNQYPWKKPPTVCSEAHRSIEPLVAKVPDDGLEDE